MILDVATLERLTKLLASPNTEPGMAARGARVTQDGRSDRRQAYRAVLVRWAQRRWLEADGAEGEWWSCGRHASAQSARVERQPLRFVKKV